MKNEMKRKWYFWRILPIAVLLFILSCKNADEQGFTINGTITEMKETPKKAYLMNDMGYPADSVDIINGKFIIKGHMKHPEIAMVTAGNSRAEFILENGTFQVTLGDKAFMVKGGKLNEIVYGFTYMENFRDNFKKSRELSDLYDRFEAKKMKKSQDSVLAQYERILTKLMAIQDQYQKNILTRHYPVLAKVFTLNNYYDAAPEYSIENRIALLDTYEKEIGKDISITKLRNMYLEEQKQQEQAQTVATGNPFKDIEATTADGKKIKLSEIISKNKYTLLDFWASWCSPCRAEFPYQQKAYEKYHKKGFEIYVVSLDDKMNSWLKAMKEENTPWYNTVDIQALKGNCATAYGVDGIPAGFLIAQDGTIVSSGDEIRGDGLEKKLKNLLK